MKRLALALACSVALATPALAKGPPWISIEMRPYGTSFLLARTFHHGTPMALPLRGSAEGLVDGRRTSVALHFGGTYEANAFTVPNTWGAGGVWVLNIGASAGDHGSAGAVVCIDRSGSPAFIRFPRSVTGESRVATRGEVDAMLRALDAGQQPPALSVSWWNPFLIRIVATFAALALLTAVGVRLLIALVRRVRAPGARAVAA